MAAYRGVEEAAGLSPAECHVFAFYEDTGDTRIVTAAACLPYGNLFCLHLGEGLRGKRNEGAVMSIRGEHFYQGVEDALLKELIDRTEPYAYRFKMKYLDPTYPGEGTCLIEMYTSAGATLILVKELAENTGPSVTNAAAAIFMKLAYLFDLDVNTTTVIAYYGPISYSDWGRDDQENYTRLLCTTPPSQAGKHRPLDIQAQHISEEEVARLLRERRQAGAPEARELAYQL
jgi:hypothetical protein